MATNLEFLAALWREGKRLEAESEGLIKRAREGFDDYLRDTDQASLSVNGLNIRRVSFRRETADVKALRLLVDAEVYEKIIRVTEVDTIRIEDKGDA